MIIKVIGTALIVCIVCAVCFRLAPGFKGVIGICSFVIIILLCVNRLGDFIDYYRELSDQTSYGVYFSAMLKALGIALICEWGAKVCTENGEGLLASGVEFAGKCEILLIALPVVKELIELSKSIMGK